MSGSSLLTLNCLVFGDDADSMFPVEIENTKSVGSLRVAIKNEDSVTFQNVRASSLDIWMVSILVDDNINDTLEELILQNDPDEGILKLSPPCRLSKYFPAEPADEHIHIIVRPRHTGEYHYLIRSSNALYLSQSQLLLEFNRPFPISPTSNAHGQSLLPTPPTSLHHLKGSRLHSLNCSRRMNASMTGIVPLLQPRQYPSHSSTPFLHNLSMTARITCHQGRTTSWSSHYLEQCPNSSQARVNELRHLKTF